MPVVQANGIDIYYEERGQGEPLVLIMGLGADGSAWEDHVKAYEKHFRCILMDNRGAGRSGKPEGPYATATMADDAVGLMDALGIEKAHFSGISMGGAIVQEAALRHPDRLLSATIIASWPKCNKYTVRVFETLREAIAVMDASSFNHLLQWLIFTPEYHENHFDDLLAREEAGKANPYPMPLHAFQAQCDACIGHDTLGRLHNISVPTLITSGDQDIFTPLHYSQTLASKIPGARLVVFEGGGHTHHWEKLDDFNRETLAFLLEHSSK